MTRWALEQIRSTKWAIGLGLLALGLTSCSGSPNSKAVQPSEAEAEPEPVVQTQPDPEIAKLSDAMLTETPQQPRSVAADLMNQTTVEARLSQVSAGRYDPFSRITEPLPKPSASSNPAPSGSTAGAANTPVASIPNGSLPAVPGSLNAPLPAPAQVSFVPITPAPPIALPTAPNAVPVPAPGPAAALPPLPVPGQLPNLPSGPLASTIVVSGVMQVGDRVSAIVSVPHEGSSRYVSVGDSIGGSVFVKRIEIGPDREPLVILEQNGQEYPRTVDGSSFS